MDLKLAEAPTDEETLQEENDIAEGWSCQQKGLPQDKCWVVAVAESLQACLRRGSFEFHALSKQRSAAAIEAHLQN